MVANTAQQKPKKTTSEVRNAAYNFAADLDVGELLTGTPTAAATGITVDNVTVNTVAITLQEIGETIAIGKGITCRIQGGTAGTTYRITFTATSDAALPQTLKLNGDIEVIEDS